MKPILALAILCSGLLACEVTMAQNKPDILASDIDSTVKAGDDFFEYANGGWIKRTPSPAQKAVGA